MERDLFKIVFFQMSTSVKKENKTAVQMLFVATPTDLTTAHADQSSLGTGKTAQVNKGLAFLHTVRSSGTANTF